ncbi:MAG TPA: transposase [Terriglobales bacterium]|nr:transposase [Terriglobales bacterium]
MTLSHLPALLSHWFAQLASCLQRRSAARLPLLLGGILFACRRRTVTAWFRAAGIGSDFRQGYTTVWAVGRRTPLLATQTFQAVKTLLPAGRLVVAVDDTPTPRYGPCVQGAGIHHNPTPGPAGEKFVYGHVWVTLAVLAKHADWGTLALPLQASLYACRKDIDALAPDQRWPFCTKLQLAAEQLHWLKTWSGTRFSSLWAVSDGAYAQRAYLRAARQDNIVVVACLRKNAALRSVPSPVRREGQRGPLPTYGKERIDLAECAGQPGGWQQLECVQYGQRVVKTIKAFEATWRPAGRRIRVVLVKEEDGWQAYFCTDTAASVVDILEAAADRGAIEQTFKDVKEVWGAGQQQVRNVHASIGAFNLHVWLYSLVEAWAWAKPAGELVDRAASPWDEEERRPSHADKRKALQREIVHQEIQAGLCGRPNKQRFRELAERLLQLAA